MYEFSNAFSQIFSNLLAAQNRRLRLQFHQFLSFSLQVFPVSLLPVPPDLDPSHSKTAGGLLFVRSAPAEEARFAPLSDALDYVYDDTGNCSRFAPGNMLEAYDWTQDAAVELSWAIEGMDADAHIALYRLDAISESADGMVILEVRTPANASTPPSFRTSRPRPCLKIPRCWVLQKRPPPTPTDV